MHCNSKFILCFKVENEQISRLMGVVIIAYGYLQYGGAAYVLPTLDFVYMPFEEIQVIAFQSIHIRGRNEHNRINGVGAAPEVSLVSIGNGDHLP